MNRKQIGTISISNEFLEQAPDEVLSVLFGNFFPIRAEWMWDKRCVEYTGYSQQFFTITEGEEAPTYCVRMNKLHGCEGVKSYGVQFELVSDDVGEMILKKSW